MRDGDVAAQDDAAPASHTHAESAPPRPRTVSEIRPVAGQREPGIPMAVPLPAGAVRHSYTTEDPDLDDADTLPPPPPVHDLEGPAGAVADDPFDGEEPTLVYTRIVGAKLSPPALPSELRQPAPVGPPPPPVTTEARRGPPLPPAGEAEAEEQAACGQTASEPALPAPAETWDFTFVDGGSAADTAPTRPAARPTTRQRGIVAPVMLAVGVLAVAALAIYAVVRDRGTAPGASPAPEPPSQPAPVEVAVADPVESTVAAEPTDSESSPAPPERQAQAQPESEQQHADLAAKTGPQRVAAPRGTPAPKRQQRRAEVVQAEPEKLPDAPSREQVIAAIAATRPALVECAGKRGGIAQVDLSVANTGRVAQALVGGDFAGTPEGSCIARALRKAVFPRFEQERFRVLYPISF